jgi:hypothetical protein
MKTKYIFYISFIAILLSSCAKDLDVEYKNKPDRTKVFTDPENVYSIAKSSFYNWYMAVNSSLSPRMSMWVMADQGTCSWANSGMFDLSSEPRKAFNNSTSYTYAYVFETYYEDMYATLNQTKNILDQLNNGMKVIINDYDKTEMVRAFTYFVHGITLGYISMVYDKVYLVDESADSVTIPLVSYKQGTASAIHSLERCVEICNNNSFTIPDDWINGSSYSSSELARLANSFAARFLVYMPRNKAENDQIDWQRVLDFADNGIQRPLEVYMDNSSWINYFHRYTVRPGWARIDCRIINLMDPRYPWRFPDDGHNPPSAQSDDKRLASDFKFNSVNNMKPERGYYHFSNYEYVRYPYAITTNVGFVVDYSLAELDLIKAEANAELGNLETAIEIINNGSRTQRGGLAPLNIHSNKERVMKALFYERDIELIQTGFGIAFFDMRRRDMLQKGTMLHFPIPAKDLMVMEMPLYTFGGVENADGINTSNGGWFPNNN